MSLAILLSSFTIGAFTATYAAAAPRAQLFGRTFVGLAARSREIAITFDDGPSEFGTPALLEVLDKHGVQATFFLIGRSVVERPDLVSAIARAGHAIGNHSFSHRCLLFLPQAEVLRELRDCDTVLSAVAPERTRLFRPPFGARRPTVLQAARSLGFTTVMWSVTCFDWQDRSADDIERIAVRQIRGGDVVLLHDGDHSGKGSSRAASVTAAERLIVRYRSEGFRFVTVPDMMRQAGQSPATALVAKPN